MGLETIVKVVSGFPRLQEGISASILQGFLVCKSNETNLIMGHWLPFLTHQTASRRHHNRQLILAMQKLYHEAFGLVACEHTRSSHFCAVSGC